MNAKRMLRGALLCGGIPLSGGIAIFLGWVILRDDGFEVMGLLWILLGLISFFSGMIFLLFYAGSARREATLSQKAILLRARLAFLLLLLNFPAMVGIIWLHDIVKHPDFEVDIRDVTQEETLTLSSPLEFTSSVRLWVEGSIDQAATVALEDRTHPITIGPGVVRWEYQGDWYHDDCHLKYTPKGVTKGSLQVTYEFR